jgi:putative ABC transport system substrate-binding protein
MRRRDLITLLGGAAAIWPFMAGAQQPAVAVIGYLGSESPSLSADRVAGSRRGLSEAGYVEGRNVGIEYRWAEGQYDRLPAMATDLVRQQVNVIVTLGALPSALAAKAATRTIPIVFATGADAVASGLVTSLNQPGGNLTRATNLNTELGPKRLELQHELVPSATIIAMLVNPTNPNAEPVSRQLQAAAQSLGLEMPVVRVSTERDLDTAFASLVRLRAGALVIGADAFFTSRSEQLAALALRHAVPAIYQGREFAAAGGLMSYGGSLAAQDRLAGIYTGRILKGEKPADLPVQQSTKVELIINLKTAKALGVTVPLALLTRADEVIE